MTGLPLVGGGSGGAGGGGHDEEIVPRLRPGRVVYTPPGGPPGNATVSKAIYAAMGEANIRAMLHDFYARLAASSIAGMFPRSASGLAHAADKSASFFVFLLGGPPLYQQRHGPPRMRMRHLPFEIDEAARAEWVRCFEATLAEAPARFAFPAEHVPGFVAFLREFSGWMVNTQRAGDAG